MAILLNMEGNVQLQINLNKIAETKDAKQETWICCELEVISSVINCTIGEQRSFMMNKYELGNMLNHLNLLLNNLENKNEYSFSFSNYECNFEIKMSTVTVDEAIEVEIWVNWGNYTKGKDPGYDVGLRFVSNIKAIQVFSRSLAEETNRLFESITVI